jgi:catechol 2,3-dioxygenase-like lactoylglutathione lyase family enzyme
MSIVGFVHVNINCSDYARSLTFYELLGFCEVIPVPPTNTPEVAAAVGMPPYRVKGALLANPAVPVMIDLLQWEQPTDASAPYPHLYHLGIARIALASDDLDGDMTRLQQAGVEFLSAPAPVTMGGNTSRFVCFADPDGTIVELVQ